MTTWAVLASRPIHWIKAALRAFDDFPAEAKAQAASALAIVAEGRNPQVAKPLTGLGSGVWELAIRQRGDAYRVVYLVQFEDGIWVVHAFQKKSKRGIATPKVEIDVVRERLKRLKESLK